MLEADTFCDNVSSSNMASACRIVSAKAEKGVVLGKQVQSVLLAHINVCDGAHHKP